MTRLGFVPGCPVPPAIGQLEVLVSLVGVVLVGVAVVVLVRVVVAVPLPLRVVGTPVGRLGSL